MYLYSVKHNEMKSRAKLIFLTFLLSPVFLFAADKNFSERPPLFQVSAGMVHSSIDLSRYLNTSPYRGFHARVATHVWSLFFISGEYSTFPVHYSPSAWDKVQTNKYDLNGHISFATQGQRTRIFFLAGLNRHEWKGTRTGYTDLDQLAKGLKEGTVVEINRWGINAGCGFTQKLYDNIGIIGDFRFNFSDANNFERVRIMDVMTTIGINFGIPYPQKNRKTKTFPTGKKIYKWTEKGAR